eukprot:UN14628
MQPSEMQIFYKIFPPLLIYLICYFFS